MRVLALLSGGKDSVCAIETARGFGWDVAAALVLKPAQDDAWMFHTPNLGVVEGVAECLGVPLVEADVRSGKGEEVEDLARSLAEAKEDFALDGLVSGALASEYQRTRIDGIGHRLGLKSFAPLWHKEPRGYVDSLVAAGWDIRFSRTAADGVPTAWAGQRLDAAKVTAMAHHRARPHVAGEGGEYETLVLDAPCYTRRIVVEEAEVDESASRATWRVRSWRTEPKA
ncbi:MAG TPA: diphthine--ammonia ligase [Candidatus Thermoplasmatota archaeon]|nr:diphthine--ammonia ligase [Candidatus Thermoplasmatota archaeon]